MSEVHTPHRYHEIYDHVAATIPKYHEVNNGIDHVNEVREFEDMNTIVDQIWILTERVHRPNTIILPLAQFRHVMTTARSATSDTTIAEFFLRTNGFVRELMSLPELATASPSGGASMLAYQKDPSVLSGIVPLAYQQMEAQVRGMEVLIPAREKIGGTVWFYPMAAAFGDGI